MCIRDRYSSTSNVYKSKYSDLTQILDSENLCLLLPNLSEFNKRICGTINKGVMTQGLNKANTLIWQVSQEHYNSFVNSPRDWADIIKILDSAASKDVEFMIDTFITPIYQHLNDRLLEYYQEGIDAQDAFNRLILGAVVSIITFGGIIMYMLVFSRSSVEFIVLKRFLRLLPLDIILKNKLIKKFLVETSPQTLMDVKIQFERTYKKATAGLAKELRTITFVFYMDLLSQSIINTQSQLHHGKKVRLQHYHCLLYTSPSPRDQA
eukprot:TRINITY_DN2163_c0_g2_i13.p1 TRINITY_DN2163_c0_g2~~TRINITY_DN2163_c0_g2_i13.p1  ORF type:complete len:265 (+),score=11.55 TRINITY_DN2163_c0_g2_i13:66-860(+)